MSASIESYRPRIDPACWAAIGDFTRAAVLDALDSVPYQLGTLLWGCTRHVAWCWQAAGLPLERSAVFHRDTIAEYIGSACPSDAEGTRRNRRAMLLSVSAALLPRTEPRLAALGRFDPIPPYTANEVIKLRSWAAGLSTERRRHDALTLLCLGLGAGLTAGEIIDLRADRVAIDGHGVLVKVTSGNRPREVPVLTAWETELAVLVADLQPVEFVFCPDHKPNTRNLVSNFVARCGPGEVTANTQRMRATWICTHIAAGTPVRTLLQASGTDTLAAFSRYQAYLGEPPADVAREYLREAKARW